jgi:hypothetical protein
MIFHKGNLTVEGWVKLVFRHMDIMRIRKVMIDSGKRQLCFFLQEFDVDVSFLLKPCVSKVNIKPVVDITFVRNDLIKVGFASSKR